MTDRIRKPDDRNRMQVAITILNCKNQVKNFFNLKKTITEIDLTNVVSVLKNMYGFEFLGINDQEQVRITVRKILLDYLLNTQKIKPEEVIIAAVLDVI